MVPAGLGSSGISEHITRNAERVEPPSLVTLSAITPGRSLRQRARINDYSFITQPLE
jgi:hypothetical protein